MTLDRETFLSALLAMGLGGAAGCHKNNNEPAPAEPEPAPSAGAEQALPSTEAEPMGAPEQPVPAPAQPEPVPEVQQTGPTHE